MIIATLWSSTICSIKYFGNCLEANGQEFKSHPSWQVLEWKVLWRRRWRAAWQVLEGGPRRGRSGSWSPWRGRRRCSWCRPPSSGATAPGAPRRWAAWTPSSGGSCNRRWPGARSGHMETPSSCSRGSTELGAADSRSSVRKGWCHHLHYWWSHENVTAELSFYH